MKIFFFVLALVIGKWALAGPGLISKLTNKENLAELRSCAGNLPYLEDLEPLVENLQYSEVQRFGLNFGFEVEPIKFWVQGGDEPVLVRFYNHRLEVDPNFKELVSSGTGITHTGIAICDLDLDSAFAGYKSQKTLGEVIPPTDSGAVSRVSDKGISDLIGEIDARDWKAPPPATSAADGFPGPVIVGEGMSEDEATKLLDEGNFH